MYLLYVDANSFVKASSSPEENQDDTFTKDYIQFSKRDLYGIREIHEQGSPNIFRLLVNSLCPLIFGHELIKGLPKIMHLFEVKLVFYLLYLVEGVGQLIIQKTFQCDRTFMY